MIRFLVKPPLMADLGPADWNALIPLARREFVLGRLAADAQADPAIWRAMPAQARQALSSAVIDAAYHQRRLRWEVNRTAHALAEIDAPVILLKGAAYIEAGLEAGRGRIASDIDILPPKEALEGVERALLAEGWVAEKQDSYDEHYYRAWMHELPPLRHKTRGMVIDVHHMILPLTARPKPDIAAMIAAAAPCGEEAAMRRFCNTDLVLHAAAHLFHDGEFDVVIRNLLELHDMLTEFGEEPGFFEALLARADEMQLARYAAYALRYTQRFMGTDIPAEIIASSRRYLPIWPILGLMDRLVAARTVALKPDLGRPRFSAAQFLLYIRSHWLKMPPLMLARHLTTKFFKRLSSGSR